MSQWIRCAEKMPDYKDVVLGYDIFYGKIGEAIMWSDRLVFVQSDDCNILFWQPLPAPPSEAEIEAAGNEYWAKEEA